MSKGEAVISVITKKAITNATGKQAVYQQTIADLLASSEVNPSGVTAESLILAHKKDAENRDVFMALRDHMATELALGKNGKGLLNNYVNLSLERIAYAVPTKAQLTEVVDAE